MSFNVKPTTDVTLSTAYTGNSTDGSIIVLCKSGIASQKVFSDGMQSFDPQNIATQGFSIPDDMITSVQPRFGQNTAAPSYKPPVLTLIPTGGGSFLPTRATQDTATLQTSVFARAPSGNTEPINVVNTLWPLLDQAVSPYLTADLLASVKNLKNSDTDFEVLPNGSTTAITGMHVYKSTSEQLGFTIGDGTTDTLVIFDGDVTLKNIVSGSARTTIFSTGTVKIDMLMVSGNSFLIIGLVGVIASGVTIGTQAPFGNGPCVVPSVTTPGMMVFISTDKKTTLSIPHYTSSANGVVKMSVLDNAFVGKKYDGGDYVDITDLEYYSPMAEGGVLDDAVMSDFLKLQLDAQFHMDEVTSVKPLPGLSSFGGSFHVQFGVNGEPYESFVVVQKDASMLPNAGVATEAHRFDDYVVDMVQTYRVSEDGYAFWGDGHYVTLNKNGDFVMSTDKLNIPKGYTLNDTAQTVISKDRLVSVINYNSQGTVDGGVDPFTQNSDGSYSSHYSRVSKQVKDDGLMTQNCTISAPYDSFVYYRPKDGCITSVVDNKGVSIENGTLLVKNTDRRSGRMIVVCTVTPTVEGYLRASQNVCHNYNRDLSVPLLVYASSDKFFADFLFSITDSYGNAVDRIVRFDAGQTLPVSGETYTYKNMPSSSGGYYVLTNSSGAIVVDNIDPHSGNDVTVNVDVVFGDMVQKAQPSTFVASDESFDYFARDQNGIVAHYGPLVLPALDRYLDVTYRPQNELDGILSGGMLVPDYVDNEYSIARRAEVDSSPIKIGTIKIYGRKSIQYASDASQAFVGLFPGNYVRATTDAPDTPSGSINVAADGTVDVHDLPFVIGMTAFIGVSVDPGSNLVIHGTQDDIEKELKNLASGSHVISEGTTIVWSVEPDDSGAFKVFSLTSGKIGDQIVIAAGTTITTYILTTDIEESGGVKDSS